MFDTEEIGKHVRDGRAELSEAFVEALAKDFAEHGCTAIRTLRETKLDAYLRLVAAVQPLAKDADDGLLGLLTEEQMFVMLQGLERWLRENPESETDTEIDAVSP